MTYNVFGGDNVMIKIAKFSSTKVEVLVVTMVITGNFTQSINQGFMCIGLCLEAGPQC